MNERARRVRAQIAVITVVVVTGLSVAVPLLDRGRDPDALAFNETGASTGYVEHHHAVCLQYGAAAWSLAAAVEVPSARLVREAQGPHRSVRVTRRPFSSFHRSRAPPLL